MSQLPTTKLDALIDILRFIPRENFTVTGYKNFRDASRDAIAENHKLTAALTKIHSEVIKAFEANHMNENLQNPFAQLAGAIGELCETTLKETK